MNENIKEIIEHIFETMDSGGKFERVPDVSIYTNNNYSGPGFVYSVDIRDAWDSWDSYSIVLDKNKKYLGTMSWITSKEGWFNDIDPNWVDRKN